MADREEISVDELLEAQKSQSSLATIEAVQDKSHLVKVTPYIRGRGCACQFALIVEKNSISKILRTSERYHCCGHILDVVEVMFREGSVLPIHEVFTEFSHRAAHMGAARQRLLAAARAKRPLAEGGLVGVCQLPGVGYFFRLNSTAPTVSHGITTTLALATEAARMGAPWAVVRLEEQREARLDRGMAALSAVVHLGERSEVQRGRD